MQRKSSETFPQRLRRMRQRRGMTQEGLAIHCYVHENMITHYESGRSMPSADVLCKMAEYFEVSVDYILCRTDDPRTF